jgi:hypothetical protein
MTDLIGLAERCEKATGPDRELEQDICDTVHGPNYMPNVFQQDGSRIPRYTASLDAAMTLVPNGMGWSVNRYASGTWARAGVYEDNGRDPGYYCDAATPALALCAAALRARATKETHDGTE